MSTTPTPMNPKWGTMTDAAELLGVSLPTIRRRIADGTIPARRFGPQIIRVPLHELGEAGEAVTFLNDRAK